MLTEEQAYAAAFRFLEDRWERLPSPELGSFLSDMSLLQDGSSADPATIGDWKKAVEYAINGGLAGPLQIKKP